MERGTFDKGLGTPRGGLGDEGGDKGMGEMKGDTFWESVMEGRGR